jgi:segregation and condensation protein B
MRLDYDSPESIAAATEALIFASDDPLSAAELRSLLLGEEHRPATLTGEAPLLDEPEEEQTSRKRKTLELSTIKTAIELINARLVSGESPYHIVEIAGGYQFATKPDYAVFVSRLYKEKSRRRLSGAALETLAIIAYKQPVSKPDVENIRGVNCDEVLKSLLEKNLITITGRSESVGRPLLYGTTDDFLRHFGLPSVKDLPKPREIEEMMKDESVKATTLDEAADEFVDPDASDSITVDEVIAVDKEENTEALAEAVQAEELA